MPCDQTDGAVPLESVETDIAVAQLTVVVNRLNTFSQTIAQFLKTLNTNEMKMSEMK